jgi:hypothetical protein
MICASCRYRCARPTWNGCWHVAARASSSIHSSVARSAPIFLATGLVRLAGPLGEDQEPEPLSPAQVRNQGCFRRLDHDGGKCRRHASMITSKRKACGVCAILRRARDLARRKRPLRVARRAPANTSALPVARKASPPRHAACEGFANQLERANVPLVFRGYARRASRREAPSRTSCPQIISCYTTPTRDCSR